MGGYRIGISRSSRQVRREQPFRRRELPSNLTGLPLKIRDFPREDGTGRERYLKKIGTKWEGVAIITRTTERNMTVPRRYDGKGQ